MGSAFRKGPGTAYESTDASVVRDASADVGSGRRDQLEERRTAAEDEVSSSATSAVPSDAGRYNGAQLRGRNLNEQLSEVAEVNESNDGIIEPNVGSTPDSAYQTTQC